ncbi:MAG: hypothetical protein OXE46_14235 [Chloroflexi bacterium]|nr:hypothetical protein [Chloroflexota bacterium]
MASSERGQESNQDLKSNFRGTAQRKGKKMAKKNRKAVPVLEKVEGQYRIVEASGNKSHYDCRVLFALYWAHPNSATVAELVSWTMYRGGRKQFKTTVIQKLRDDGRVCVDPDTGEKVSITPMGRYFVYENWPELNQ